MATLKARIEALATQIGAEIKAVRSEIGAGGGGSDPWTRKFITSDFINTTTSFITITGFSVTIPANTNFVIELDLLLAAVATTNLPRVGINWSSNLSYAEGELWYSSSATAKVFTLGHNLTTAGNLQMPVGTAPIAGVYGAGGRFKGRTSAQCIISLQLAAETAAPNGAILKNGSEFRSRSGF